MNTNLSPPENPSVIDQKIIDQHIKDAVFLIVDDNMTNIDLLREMLLLQGYHNIHSVTDPRQAPRLCRTISFDILLIDIRMPYMNGFQLIEALKPVFADNYVPILVLTAQIDQDTRRKALETGANDFLTKPFVTWELLQRVRNMLQTRILYKQVRAQNQELERRVVERTAALSVALESARSAHRAKLDFLSVMSHELRTPLNAIIGFAEVIGSQAMGALGHPDYLEFISLINENGRHLLSMVNKILEYTRGATSTIDLEESEIDLDELIQFCVMVLHPKTRAKDVSVSISSPSKIVLFADERRLREMVLNVLENAIKFNYPHGVITIGALAAPIEGDNSAVAIRIIDHGPGIAPEILARIFDPFTQGDSSLERRFDGIGLGLPIVQRFAFLHGGKVRIDSTVGQGTVVTLLFPGSRCKDANKPND
ncbi:Histidine kinase [Azospirillaceae bacterium]